MRLGQELLSQPNRRNTSDRGLIVKKQLTFHIKKSDKCAITRMCSRKPPTMARVRTFPPFLPPFLARAGPRPWLRPTAAPCLRPEKTPTRLPRTAARLFILTEEHETRKIPRREPAPVARRPPQRRHEPRRQVEQRDGGPNVVRGTQRSGEVQVSDWACERCPPVPVGCPMCAEAWRVTRVFSGGPLGMTAQRRSLASIRHG